MAGNNKCNAEQYEMISKHISALLWLNDNGGWEAISDIVSNYNKHINADDMLEETIDNIRMQLELLAVDNPVPYCDGLYKNVKMVPLRAVIDILRDNLTTTYSGC